jgi:hypothetical protein
MIVRVLGLLALLVALALVLGFGAATYLRTPTGINTNVARDAAGRAAGSAATHARDVVKVPTVP